MVDDIRYFSLGVLKVFVAGVFPVTLLWLVLHPHLFGLWYHLCELYTNIYNIIMLCYDIMFLFYIIVSYLCVNVLFIY